jgi:membrane protein
MLVVASWFFSTPEIVAFMTEAINTIFGGVISDAAVDVASEVGQLHSQSNLSSIGFVGLFSLILSVSFIFLAYKDALDVIWHRPVATKFDLTKSLKKYFGAYLMVLLSSTFLFLALLINSIASLAKYIVPGESGLLDNIADLVFSIGSFVVGIAILAVIMKLMIHRDVAWKSLIKGSVITIIFVVIGNSLLGFYLANFASQSVNGAVSGAFLMLLWLYYQSQIILAGAQLTKVLAIRNDKIKIKGVKI